jgi:regulator of protease activity HflC (stomatin/prohibitin superfamily)
MPLGNPFPLYQILSRDSVTVTVDAVVYYRVSNPTMATNNVEDYGHSTHLLGATTLRSSRARIFKRLWSLGIDSKE